MERKQIPLRWPVKSAVLVIVLVCGLLVLSAGGPEASMENYFLYFPDKQISMTPENMRLSFEDVTIPAEDGTLLHGWFIPANEQGRVILFFHGNAGNISHRIDNLLRLNRLGLAVFIFDYRGYGRSQGETTEPGIYSDGRGALSWLKNRGYSADQMIFFGRSLGAAAALQLALEEPPAALIIESPFSSIAAMGKHHYPILYRLFGWLIKAKYDNEEKISRLRTPLLLIHGTKDAIVPVAMGEKLYSLAPEPKQLYLLKGVDHNDGSYFHDIEYWRVWKDFLNKLD